METAEDMMTRRFSSGFTTFRIWNSKHGALVPFGIAVWDAQKQTYALRFVEDDEKVAGGPKTLPAAIRVFRAQIEGWAEKRTVPYAMQELQPCRTAFWEAVRAIMTSAIRLDTPQPADLENPHHVEILFEAAVAPQLREEYDDERRENNLGQGNRGLPLQGPSGA